MADEDQTRIVQFCSQCFATDENGSWGGSVFGHYCTNCGCGGTSVQIPYHAAASIRTNASWVGRRYYPSQEDIELSAELKKLRSLMQTYPGRSAVPCEVTPGNWVVTQRVPGGRAISTWFSASSPEEAVTVSGPHLPYFTEDELK